MKHQCDAITAAATQDNNVMDQRAWAEKLIIISLIDPQLHLSSQFFNSIPEGKLPL